MDGGLALKGVRHGVCQGRLHVLLCSGWCAGAPPDAGSLPRL
jgi:hypothetical protein